MSKGLSMTGVRQPHHPRDTGHPALEHKWPEGRCVPSSSTLPTARPRQPRKAKWRLKSAAGRKQSSEAKLTPPPGWGLTSPARLLPQQADTHPLSHGFRREARITKSWGLASPPRAGLMTW